MLVLDKHHMKLSAGLGSDITSGNEIDKKTIPNSMMGIR